MFILLVLAPKYTDLFSPFCFSVNLLPEGFGIVFVGFLPNIIPFFGGALALFFILAVRLQLLGLCLKNHLWRERFTKSLEKTPLHGSRV